MPENSERSALTEAVYYILLLLHKPMHGYLLMQTIEALTEGRVVLGPGTLYGAINALLQKQWIETVVSVENTRKKEYIITDLGKEIFSGEIERLRSLINDAWKYQDEQQ